MIFNGMRIMESSLLTSTPKVQLSADFTACSAEMKIHMNAWLLEKFGVKYTAYKLGNNIIIMHPEQVKLLKETLK